MMYLYVLSRSSVRPVSKSVFFPKPITTKQVDMEGSLAYQEIGRRSRVIPRPWLILLGTTTPRPHRRPVRYDLRRAFADIGARALQRAPDQSRPCRRTKHTQRQATRCAGVG